jgi:hypothetical protein
MGAARYIKSSRERPLKARRGGPFPMGTLKKPGGVIMNRVLRLLAITGALMATFGATLSFAQQDNVTIKRIIGDIYEVTISGERNGEFAEVQKVRTAKDSYGYDNTTFVGGWPSLNIYAVVVSGGDENAKSSYSLTFREELPFFVYEIHYYVSDDYFGNPELVDSLLLDNYSRNYDSHHDDGYYFGLDLTNSSITPQAEDTITIRNLKVEGVEDPFRATFQWNPRNFKFELKEAGPEN